MNPILTLAIKDLRLMFRDKLGLFFVAAFPILMGIFFGMIGVSMGSEEGGAGVDVAVVDADDSTVSHRFIEALATNPGMTIHPLTRESAVANVRKGSLAGYIAIPEGFGETAGVFWAEAPEVVIGVDPSRRAESSMLQGFVMQAMGVLIQDRFNDPAAMRAPLQQSIGDIENATDLPAGQRMILLVFLRAADTFFGSFDSAAAMNPNGGAGDDAGGGHASREVDQEGDASGMPTMQLANISVHEVGREPTEFETLQNKLKSPWDISFPPAIMWGVMACVTGFAVQLVKERSEGTFLRLCVAPISRVQILGGKATACFITVTGVIAMMMVIGQFLGMQLHSIPLLVLASVCVALCFVGLMMLMSVIARTEQAAAGAGWAVIVVMCMFGGGMIPLAFMPKFMKTLSHFSPVKWGILALEGAIWRGFTLSEMLFPCVVLVGIGAFCFILGASMLSLMRT